ncbi:WD repeat-containing protein 13 [Vitis vinifera]|uniref:WD repeat-containing protein 13 n=1 Tax=Vitis vinifera TaxID=29760 RepID=A0A438DMF1_VITVI|nr:WD repeat-containing protein 13 [Vitis vinifera]
MAEETIEKSSSSEEEKNKAVDPTFFSCLLQPSSADSDPQYIGIRRLLLRRKAESGVHRRKDWRCNGKGYVAYRNYIRRPRNWESLHAPSHSSTPGQRGNLLVDASVGDGFRLQLHSPFCLRWTAGVPAGTYEVAIKLQVTGPVSAQVQVIFRVVSTFFAINGELCFQEDSFVLFPVTVLKFGNKSSDLLAYGAADGTLTVCTVSQPPSIIKELRGHSKDVTEEWVVEVWDLQLKRGGRGGGGWNPHCSWAFNDWEVVLVEQFLMTILGKRILTSHPTISTLHPHQWIKCQSMGDIKRPLYSSNIWNLFTIVYSFSSCPGLLQIWIPLECPDLLHECCEELATEPPYQEAEWNSNTQFRVDHYPVLIAIGVATIVNLRSQLFSTEVSLCWLGPCIADMYSRWKVNLTPRCSLKLTPRVHSIRASFCPLLSLEKGEYIVAGSEDSNVYFYDLTRPRHTCVNKLQGHGSPVIGVAWNHGENLLASSDSDGTVIVWKRAKTS